MKPRLLFSLLLFIQLLSCTYENAVPLTGNATCGVLRPDIELEWLKNLIIEIESDPKYVSVIITAYDYKGQTVFNIQDAISSCAFCDLRICSGNKFTRTNVSDFISNKTNERKVWCQNKQLCEE
jgi:hypothetical protein